MKNADIFDKLVANWPSAIVARSEVGRFSGGILNARTCANRDCLGLGPPRVRIGRRIGYPVVELAEWMRSRSSTPDNR